MKNKKVVSLLLSAIMLVGSTPAMVLAQGDEGTDGQAMADQNTDEPEENGAGENDAEENEDPGYLGEVTEETTFPVGQIEAYGTRTLTFTPSSTGRYGLLCAEGRELTVTVTDDTGSEVPFAKNTHKFRFEIKEMDLKEGTKYTIKIQAADHATLTTADVYFYICPVYDLIPYGESTLFAPGGEYTEYYFIPEESGRYTFAYSQNSTRSLSVSIEAADRTVNSSSTNNELVAELEAGVQYKISFSCGGNDTNVNVIHINAYKGDKSLALGENEVELEAKNKESIFSFTPEKSGVYVFESKGEYDTHVSLKHNSGYDEGEGKNFRCAEYLTADNTYFLRIQQNGPDRVTVPVFVSLAEEVQPGQECTFEAMKDDSYFFAVTPTEDGWYYLDSGSAYHSIYVQDSNQTTVNSINEDAWYMYSGETYYVRYTYSDNQTAQVKFTIRAISDELEYGTSTSVKVRSDKQYGYFMTFTPEKDDVYLFTSDIKTDSFYVSDTKTTFVTERTYSNDTLAKTASLSAGKTYLVYITVGSNTEEDYVITVNSHEETVEAGIKYAVDAPYNTRKRYSFTPEKSGYYVLYHIGGLSYVTVKDGSNSVKSVFYHYGEQTFYSEVINLEAGKTYGVELHHYKTKLEGLYWGIMPVEALEVGDNIPVSALGGYAHYTFTPSEDGVYTFTSDMLANADQTNTCIFTDNGNSVETVISTKDTIIKNSLSASLEKGKTYLIKIELKTKADTTSTMNVVKEQKLKLGDNTVSIVARDSRTYYQNDGICSFTPEEDGLYSFTSQSADDGEPRITIYDPAMTKIIDIGCSYPSKFFEAKAILEAGVTYYVNIHDYSEYDLQVEVKKGEVMEAKLEGYSLSLDGTIAINLYMTLNEQVVKSNTAVLQYTRADGTIVSYDMNKAEKKELNGKSYYVFHLPVAAKDMTTKLKAQIVDPDSEFKGKEYTFTVKEYAEYIMNHATSAYTSEIVNQEFYDALPMVYALLNYGAAAQKYFGVGVTSTGYVSGVLANENVGYNDRRLGNVPTSTLPQYNPENVNLPDGVTFAGASLYLESETTLKFYFSNPSGVKLSFFDGNGTRLSSGTSGDYITVNVKNIPAHKLSDYVTLIVKAEGDAGEYSITYNPMTYCYNVLTRPLSETRTQVLKDLMKAFYFYNQAAVRYMAAKGEN